MPSGGLGGSDTIWPTQKIKLISLHFARALNLLAFIRLQHTENST